MIAKPIIGVTANVEYINALSNTPDEFLFVRSNYLNAIIKNGGIPVVIDNQINQSDIANLLSCLDGILLIGGQDVDSRCYNEECEVNYSEDITDSGQRFFRSHRDSPNYTRDLFEIELYKQANKFNIPVLGICRGCQLINVAEGGNLYQEMPETHIIHNIVNEQVPSHTVNIKQDSLAYKIFNKLEITTCSIHHQSIKKISSNLLASGLANDGIIEIIEHINPEKFILGIQGHPERAYQIFEENNLLFQKFIEACLNKKVHHEK